MQENHHQLDDAKRNNVLATSDESQQMHVGLELVKEMLKEVKSVRIASPLTNIPPKKPDHQ